MGCGASAPANGETFTPATAPTKPSTKVPVAESVPAPTVNGNGKADMGPKRTSFDEMKKASMHRVSSQDQVTVKQGHVLWNPRPIRQGAALQYKSKIICTLGPSSRDVPVMEQMLKAGMSIARFNFSHGEHSYHQETLNNLRKAMKNTGLVCGVLLDTKGPEIRTGLLEGGGKVQLEAGQELTLTTDYTFAGNKDKIACSYKALARDVKPGSKILAADGSLTLTVLECDIMDGLVKCRCENSAKLGEKKNMNLPGVIVDLPTITEKDIKDIIEWGVPNKVDYIAASFVRKGSDLDMIRGVLGEAAGSISIISKVENHEGLDNFDDIVAKSDGVMIARGDLGMEIEIPQIFLAQKRMIKRCNAAGKPVVTATQMLESMTGAPRPTRAEATDVANAVLDGTDCVMLSGETAAGPYPVEAVSYMARICGEAEAHIDDESVFRKVMDSQPIPMTPFESISSSAVRMSSKVGAKLIIVLSRSGATARLVAKYRPDAPILMAVVDELGEDQANNLARRSLCYRGIIPYVFTFVGDYREQMKHCINFAKEDLGLVNAGDKIVGIHALGGDSVMKVVEVP